MTSKSPDCVERLNLLVDGEEWRRVERIEDAGPDDAVFAVDTRSRRIRFGDGVHGRVPPPRAAVLVETYAEGPNRLRYFSGRLLTADDLAADQEYLLGRLRRHNRMLHGWGVVDGLDVSVDGGGSEVVVEPGYAIDACGDEIELTCVVRIPLPSGREDGPRRLAVRLAHAERPTKPVPIADGEPVPSRTADVAVVRLDSGEASAAELTLAELVRVRGRWRVDPAAPARRLTRD